jgi:16S rRNA (uracil1498-N3)-methyltransferase
MQHFFVPPASIRDTEVVLTDPDIIHQLSRVLRVQEGEKIVLLDNSGAEFEVKINEINKNEIRGKILSQKQNQAEPAIQITLFQALTKSPDRFEQVVQHGTEVGITKFVPIITERTEAQSLRKPERLQRIIREAAEQSERGIVPELTEPTTLDKLFKAPPAGVSIIGDSYSPKPLLAELLPKLKQAKHINLMIGPEGGFSEREITTAEKAGIQKFSLGLRILRAETAGVAVASAILFS